jgi:hypothetical protein
MKIIGILTLFITTAIPTIGQTTPLEHNNKLVEIAQQTVGLCLLITNIIFIIGTIILGLSRWLDSEVAHIMAPTPMQAPPKPATPKPAPSTELQDISPIF